MSCAIRRTLFVIALLMLAAASLPIWAQPASSPSRPREEVGAASAAAASASGSSISIVPALQSSCASCPAPAGDALAQRVEALARAVESAASAAKPPLIDPWQDSKSVLLNMLSNRLDAWIFGDGKGSMGVAAYVAAVLAFSISLIRLMLATAMLNPATPPGAWGEFKAWTRRSGVVRGMNVVLAALAVLFTGAALYVVLTARATPDVAQASIGPLQESLKVCQAGLSAAAQRQPVPEPAAPSASSVREALDKVSRSCEAAFRTTDARMAQIQEATNVIEGKQPWPLTKVLVFLATIYLVVAITYLTVLVASRK